MLRTTLISLLLGGCAALVTVLLLFSPLPDSASAGGDINWQAENISVRGASSNIENGTLQLQVGPYRTVIVDLPVEALNVDGLPYLHLRLGEFPDTLGISVAWSKPGKRQQLVHALEVRPKHSHWLTMSELDTWRGEIGKLNLILSAPAESAIEIESVSLRAPSVLSGVKAIANDWATFWPWNRDSMNTNSATTKLSPLYPVLGAAFFLFFSLAIYLLIALLTGRQRKIDWRVPGLIFLACWLLLDLRWQYQLLRQAAETRSLFYGKSSDEKLAVGPDAELVKFVSTARAQIDSPDARVFIAASDNYSGLRAAYYMYPRNVFWAIHGREMPWPIYWREGDYILMYDSAELRVNALNSTLLKPGVRQNVDILYKDGRNYLVRLN